MTTTEKIMSYLGDLEVGEMVPVTHFTEAYGYDEARKALFSLAADEKVYLTAISSVKDFCEKHVCEVSDIIVTFGDCYYGYVQTV
jgi:hypothetical protein